MRLIYHDCVGVGKTYTMGSAFPQIASGEQEGVIPKAVNEIFKRIGESSDEKEYAVRVGFVEIYKEQIRDLSTAKANQSVHIRELPNGGIVLAGATEVSVKNEKEMAEVLERGTCLRATGSTNMNQRSSRSHAIFTITLEQKTKEANGKENLERQRSLGRQTSVDSTEQEGSDESEVEDGVEDVYLCAKMHLVDLAGSERAKRTKSVGQRLKEGIKINHGLFTLANVINALVEQKSHVPYRDSKLTRMLQDSLGGNSKTLMIACVSPADVNLEESLNTLRYANRARSIKNKPVVNRDPVAAQIASLRQQLATVKAENANLRKQLGISQSEDLSESKTPEDLKLELESTRSQLTRYTSELSQAKKLCDELREDLRMQTEDAVLAVMQRDKMAQTLKSFIGENEANHIIEKLGASLESDSVEAALIQKVQDLQDELIKTKSNSQTLASPRYPSSLGPLNQNVPAQELQTGRDETPTVAEFSGAEDDYMEVMASQMDHLEMELEAKEAAIAKVTSHANMKIAYQKQLNDLQKERDRLAKERSTLLAKVKDIQSASAEERMKLERFYKGKLRELDAKAKSIDRKEQKIRNLESAQQRALQKVKDLEVEIKGIKSQKAALQKQTEKAGKEYIQWKKQRDKEVMRLKREKQSDAVRIQKMQAENSRKEAYVRRKIEEAAAARKRLQILEGKKNSQNQQSAHTSSPFRSESAVTEWLESELDSCCSSIQLQKILDGEKAARMDAARQLRDVERKLAAVKNPHWWGKISSSPSSGEKSLKERQKMLTEKSCTHGKQIQELQLALAQAKAQEEKRGEGAADAKRWNFVSTVGEARETLTFTFKMASKYKSLADDAQNALNELGEEMEMLKLKLEVAEAERLEQSMQMESLQRKVSNLGSSASQTKPEKVSMS